MAGRMLSAILRNNPKAKATIYSNLINKGRG